MQSDPLKRFATNCVHKGLVSVPPTQVLVPRGRQGWTLTEILASVVVVAILAALLLPTLAVVRRSAEMAVCLSSLRQMAMGLQGYTQDHRGCLPIMRDGDSQYWLFRLAPYVDATGSGVESGTGGVAGLNASFWSVFKGCKARRHDSEYLERMAQSAYQAVVNPGYVYNYHPDGDQGVNWGPLSQNAGRIRLATINQADKRGVFADGDSIDSGWSCQLKSPSHGPHERHGNATCYAFFSGRTAMLSGNAAAVDAWK